MIENVDDQESGATLDFDNTEIAFRGKSDDDLNQSYQLFKLINNRILAVIGPPITSFALNIGLPISGIIKKTFFKQFCGGETIKECKPVVDSLWNEKVGTILDYSVEGLQEESAYINTANEIINTIKHAELDDRISLCVFKVSGVARFDLLEKISEGVELSAAEETEYFKVKGRVNNICKTAYDADVQVMVDAEESWIQIAIDNLVVEMMQLYNLEKAIVYNTYQLYKVDGLITLKDHYIQAETGGFVLGAKLVRGAYMEKERARAIALNYKSPIHATKQETDRNYNEALSYCVQHLKYIALVAGTHNEESCAFLAKMLKNTMQVNHLHAYFSQLLGMSDNLSFNLAHAGYNVAKYVPYGPVKAVMPYLFRRANENSAVKGQVGRELRLIIKERKRRGL
ncbi:MAG TPA: proline dehydrogenase family protein [Pedobacter sp.]|jgi:proline dehydrogenase